MASVLHGIRVIFILFLVLSLRLCSVARAEAPGPEGLWKTIDDRSGKARSLVRIEIEDGKLRGRVDTLFRERGENPDPRCGKCSGALRDRPVRGMRVLWDLEPEGDGWGRGFILDPENGREYRCRVRVLGDGGKLEVRGYLGIALLGRSQVWERYSPGR